MPRLVTLRPGARGTRRLQKQFGDQLLYVRYRYDPRTCTKLKTVELVVDSQPWIPNDEIEPRIRFPFGDFGIDLLDDDLFP